MREVVLNIFIFGVCVMNIVGDTAGDIKLCSRKIESVAEFVIDG